LVDAAVAGAAEMTSMVPISTESTQSDTFNFVADMDYLTPVFVVVVSGS
jgi:hypothetical protein